MPIACLLAHDPEPKTALLLDRVAYASCRRCGAGLIDRGAGWTSPLSRMAVLLRTTMPTMRSFALRQGAGLAPDL